RLQPSCKNNYQPQQLTRLLLRIWLISCTTITAALLLIPCPSRAQTIIREAVSSFPADSQQLTYVNLSEMRSLANYPQIRQRLFTSQLRNFEDSLRSTGNDPEKDVDEVVVGTRIQATQGGALGGIFGVAQGHFQAGETEQYYRRAKLPTSEYDDQRLYPVGSSEARSQLCFTFLSASLAAFGRLSDLKALLDTRRGTRPALAS